MSLSIRFTEQGKITLHDLHIENQTKIKHMLKQLADNPKLGKELTGRLLEYHTLQAGNNRAIYVKKEDKIIVQYV